MKVELEAPLLALPSFSLDPAWTTGCPQNFIALAPKPPFLFSLQIKVAEFSQLALVGASQFTHRPLSWKELALALVFLQVLCCWFSGFQVSLLSPLLLVHCVSDK